MSAQRVLRRMLAVDLRFGMREVAGRFVLSALLMTTLVVLFRFMTIQADGSFRDVSFIDCFASLFGGTKEYEPQQSQTFNVPASWLCVCLMGAFVVLSYPTSNLESIGVKQCVVARGRWCWWISKCLWTIGCTFLYWMLAVAIAMLASTAEGFHANLTLSSFTVDVLGFFAAGNSAAYAGSNELVMFIVGVPITLSALYLVQLAISINTNPLAAFAVTAALLFYAAFYLSPMLSGNYLMLARSNLVINNGVSAAFGIALAAAVGAIAVLAGGMVFSHHDLLGKERYSQ